MTSIAVSARVRPLARDLPLGSYIACRSGGLEAALSPTDAACVQSDLYGKAGQEKERVLLPELKKKKNPNPAEDCRGDASAALHAVARGGD